MIIARWTAYPTITPLTIGVTFDGRVYVSLGTALLPLVIKEGETLALRREGDGHYELTIEEALVL